MGIYIAICLLLGSYWSYRLTFDEKGLYDAWNAEETSAPFWSGTGSLFILALAWGWMGTSWITATLFTIIGAVSLIYIIPSIRRQRRLKKERDDWIDADWAASGGVGGFAARLEQGLKDGSITYNPTPKYQEPEPQIDQKPSKLAGAAAFGVGAYLGYKAVAGDVEAENRKREAKNLVFQIESWTKELRSPYLSESSRRMYEGNIATAQAKLAALQVR